MEKPTPKLLTTYGEARLFVESRGYGLTKATEYLSELPGLKGFHLSHTVWSRKTSKGGDLPLEPELAVAIEDMKVQGSYERQAAIVEAGLRVLRGQPPSVDVRQLAKDLREHLASNELAEELADSLTEKTEPGSFVDNVACGIADRLRASRLIQELGERVDRLSVKRLAITAAVAALVGYLALLLGPPLPGRTIASPATPLMLIVTNPVPGGSPVRLDPGSLFAMAATMGEKPLDQTIPTFTLPGQKVAPCDAGLDEEAINGNCWIASRNMKPPCGRLFRQGDVCYRPVAADPAKPGELAPNRSSSP